MVTQHLSVSTFIRNLAFSSFLYLLPPQEGVMNSSLPQDVLSITVCQRSVPCAR